MTVIQLVNNVVDTIENEVSVMDQGQNYNRGDFSATLSACWTGLGWARHCLDLFFSLSVLCVLFCLNSAGFKCCMKMASHFFYFRIQFSVNHIICLHTFFLEMKSSEVEGETRCDTISMLIALSFFQLTVKSIHSKIFVILFSWTHSFLYNPVAS